MKRTPRSRPPVRIPSGFTGFRFPPEVILLAVRWYLRYGLSYQDLWPPQSTNPDPPSDQRRGPSPAWASPGHRLGSNNATQPIHLPLALVGVVRVGVGVDSPTQACHNVALLAGVAPGVRVVIAHLDSRTGSLLVIGVFHSSFNTTEAVRRTSQGRVRGESRLGPRGARDGGRDGGGCCVGGLLQQAERLMTPRSHLELTCFVPAGSSAFYPGTP